MTTDTQQLTQTSGETGDDISGRDLAIRVGWIAVRLILVYLLADEFQPFFYQAF
jgi:hypothetical protein